MFKIRHIGKLIKFSQPKQIIDKRLSLGYKIASEIKPTPQNGEKNEKDVHQTFQLPHLVKPFGLENLVHLNPNVININDIKNDIFDQLLSRYDISVPPTGGLVYPIRYEQFLALYRHVAPKMPTPTNNPMDFPIKNEEKLFSALNQSRSMSSSFPDQGTLAARFKSMTIPITKREELRFFLTQPNLLIAKGNTHSDQDSVMDFVNILGFMPKGTQVLLEICGQDQSEETVRTLYETQIGKKRFSIPHHVRVSGWDNTALRELGLGFRALYIDRLKKIYPNSWVDLLDQEPSGDKTLMKAYNQYREIIICKRDELWLKLVSELEGPVVVDAGNDHFGHLVKLQLNTTRPNTIFLMSKGYCPKRELIPPGEF